MKEKAKRVTLREAVESVRPRGRLTTGLIGLDRVLGGGLVPGSTILLGHECG